MVENPFERLERFLGNNIRVFRRYNAIAGGHSPKKLRESATFLFFGTFTRDLSAKRFADRKNRIGNVALFIYTV